MLHKNIAIYTALFFIGTSNASKQDIELKELSPFEKLMAQIEPEQYDTQEIINAQTEDLVFEDTYFCDECFEHFSNKANLSFHILVKKHTTQIAQCPFNGCNEILKSMQELPEHIAQYHDSRQCPCCLKNFLKKTELVRHMNDCHTCIAMPCPHDTCNAWFSSKKEWRKHIAKPHSTVLCPLCLKTFIKQVMLAIHLFKHGYEPDYLICPHDQCPFWTKSKDLLLEHITKKHATNKEPYINASDPYWWRFWQLMGKYPEKLTRSHNLYEKTFIKID